MIKVSDMDRELKFEIMCLLREALNKLEKEHIILVSEYVVKYLENKYPGAWMCIIGKKFCANVSHEPGFFMRAKTEHYHFLVFMIRDWNKAPKQII